MASISIRQSQIVLSPCKRIVTQEAFANELRERELTYINLIRDLYQQNSYLRSILDSVAEKQNTTIQYNRRMHMQITPRVKQANIRYQVIQNRNKQPVFGRQIPISMNLSRPPNTPNQNTNENTNKGFEKLYPWNQLQNNISRQANGGFTFAVGLNKSVSDTNINNHQLHRQTRPIIILGDKENLSVNVSREKGGRNKNRTIENSKSVIHLGGSTQRFMNDYRKKSPRYANMSPIYGDKLGANQAFQGQALYKTGHCFYNVNSSIAHQSKKSNTIINSLNSPNSNQQNGCEIGREYHPNFVHQIRRTLSPPLAFNKNIVPQREFKNVVNSKPIPFATIMGKNAESRQYAVQPVYYRENYMNQNGGNPRLTEKSIRQEVVNDHLKSLVNISNQKQQNSYKQQDNPYNKKNTLQPSQQDEKSDINANLYTLKKLCQDIDRNTENIDNNFGDITNLDRNKNGIFNNRFASFNEQEIKQAMRPFETVQYECDELTKRQQNEEITVRVHSANQAVKMSKLSQAAMNKQVINLQNVSSSAIAVPKKKRNEIYISNRIYL